MASIRNHKYFVDNNQFIRRDLLLCICLECFLSLWLFLHRNLLLIDEFQIYFGKRKTGSCMDYNYIAAMMGWNCCMKCFYLLSCIKLLNFIDNPLYSRSFFHMISCPKMHSKFNFHHLKFPHFAFRTSLHEFLSKSTWFLYSKFNLKRY